MKLKTILWKISLLITLIMIFISQIFGSDSIHSPNMSLKKSTSLPTLEIDGNILRYNGNTLRFMDRVETWIKVLGPPSKILIDKNNSEYIWESLGLRVFVSSAIDGRVYISGLKIWLRDVTEFSESDRYYRHVEHDLDHGFPGKIILQGIVLESRTPHYRALQKAIDSNKTFIDAESGQHPAFGYMFLFGQDGFNMNLEVFLRCPENSKLAKGKNTSVTRYFGHIPIYSSSTKDVCNYYFEYMTLTVAD